MNHSRPIGEENEIFRSPLFLVCVYLERCPNQCLDFAQSPRQRKCAGIIHLYPMNVFFFDLYCVNAVCLGHMGYSASLQPGTFSVDIAKQLQQKHHNEKKKHPEKAKDTKLGHKNGLSLLFQQYTMWENVSLCIAFLCVSSLIHIGDGFRTGVFAFFAP